MANLSLEAVECLGTRTMSDHVTVMSGLVVDHVHV